MSGQLPGSALYDGGWYKVLQDMLTDLQGTNNLPGKQQKLQRGIAAEDEMSVEGRRHF
jgi:hypothetical protein